MPTTEDRVRDVSQQFYAALTSMANGNAGPMANIWSHSATVTTMHPIGGREVGWDEVKGPWQQVAEISSDGQINLTDQLIQVFGEIAYEVGNEKGTFKLGGEEVSVDHRVTNIYRREADEWKIVHHHADISPAMVELLERLMG